MTRGREVEKKKNGGTNVKNGIQIMGEGRRERKRNKKGGRKE